MERLIQPRVLKGFRDYLPPAEITRASLIEQLIAVFRAHGFVPIDTPALEYAEILLRKSDGETEKQVFRFQDNGGRDVALRFDLTVPFARFVAEHAAELTFPFKRYHIAKVWRGEKPQAGRFREFMQCDFDLVGSESASADFDILSLMYAALAQIGAPDVTIRLSHRGAFNDFLTKLGVADRSEDILRAVDKLTKIGRNEVYALLAGITGSDAHAAQVLSYITARSSYDETLAHMASFAGADSEGIARLRELRKLMQAAGIAVSFVLDPSVTRGLDYYTGVVFETFLNDLPEIGSVCSGGRYDNLSSLYTKERLSGVGASVGLDRLIAALEQLGALEPAGGFLDALVFCTDSACAAQEQSVAAKLRQIGVSCEVFPYAKKMSAQYGYAEKKGIPFGIFVQADGSLTIKNLATREQTEHLAPEQAAGIIKC
jgi:histidyl-tRNA synthetase